MTTTAWPEVPLGEVVTEAKPGFASGHDLEEGVFQFRMNNLTRDGRLDLTKRRRVPPGTPRLGSYLIEPGDVLFNATNSPELVGKTAYIEELDEPAVFSNHFVRLRAREARMTGRYLARWLQFQWERGLFRLRAKQWVNQATFGRDALLDLMVALPPLEEQRRIAAILDAADELRAKRRESLALLDSLTESIFRSVIVDGSHEDWPLVPVGEISEVQGGLQVTAARAPHPIEVPYLRVANVFRGRLDLTEVKLLRVTAVELERTRLIPGDLVVVEGHGNAAEIGRVGRWSGEIPDCVHQNHLIRIRVDTQLARPRFVEAYLNSVGGRRALLRAARTTSGLNTISTKDVRAAEVRMPPLRVQKHFERQLDHADADRRFKAIHSDELDALFASLQHRAFRGEL